ncbi:hypothetical protein BELL_0031g00140 [Botrytis elliptica]|uniref:Uncharacterized protein n=1 Tax=Botrytis elliptica TaxID=278938 RepID=A0A4Z1K625_9HELO|nr:hypothetical protein BELL_0031g00140 [Botrytis elliptica]
MDRFRRKDETPKKTKLVISNPVVDGSDGSGPWNRAFPQAYVHKNSAQGNTGGVSSQSNFAHGDQAPHGSSSDTQYAHAEGHNHASSSFSPIASPHHQSNHPPPRPARPQQSDMNASMARQSSDTGRPRSQDHTTSTQRNSSRPPSAHSRASSGGAPPNDTASTSQRGSSDSSRSHSSTVSSRDPFEYDSPENKKRLEKKE